MKIVVFLYVSFCACACSFATDLSDPCDFNADDVCDLNDIDALLYTGLVTADDSTYDVDNDGVVTHSDLDAFLIQVGSAPGDTNLDGVVDSSDLNALALNWSQPASSWGQGDFDGDQVSGVNDLNVLAINWRLSFSGIGGPISPIPEPGGTSAFVLSVLVGLKCRRGIRTLRREGD